MGRRSDHSIAELADMIVKTASAIVTKDGLAKLSTRKIAAEIGYTVGTLYNIFQNMDDILIHVNGVTLDKLLKCLKSVIKKSPSNTVVENLANAYINFGIENYNTWSLLFEYRFQDGQVFPRWYREKIESIFDLVRQALKANIPDIKDEVLKESIMVLWAGIHGICILVVKGKLSRTGVESHEAMMMNFVNNYLSGVKHFSA
jgi:AcrR family transcriptional regulator